MNNNEQQVKIINVDKYNLFKANNGKRLLVSYNGLAKYFLQFLRNRI